MRVAFWSPLPPDDSRVADYASVLLENLREDFEITAVVANDSSGREAPAGVPVITAGEYDANDFDIDLYQMGNNLQYHSYIHSQAFRIPGVLILHDPALTGFYESLLGGSGTTSFYEEALFNVPEGSEPPLIETHSGDCIDSLAVLMSRSIATTSLTTIVHSDWARCELQGRWQLPTIYHVPRATPLLGRQERSSDAPLAVGIFGELLRSQKVDVVLQALGEVVKEFPTIRLVTAGLSEDVSRRPELQLMTGQRFSSDALTVVLDPSAADLERLLQEVDVVIVPAWPTAGETSAEVMGAFAAGKVVVTSDVPQYREFAQEFCIRIPTQQDDELAALIDVLRELAGNPVKVRVAGRHAYEYVERYAEPALVARRIAELVRLARRPNEVEPVIPAVNAIASWAATTGLAEAARRVTLSLCKADVKVAIEDFDYGAPQSDDRVPPVIQMLPTGRPYGIDLVFLNVNELLAVPEEYLDRGKHYKIGSWYWELPDFSRTIREQIKRVDEIWVASYFVRDAFLQYTNVPIQVFPAIVEPREDNSLSREDFGIDPEKCMFFFNFDANSTFARKNPWGVIDAYRTAFTPTERRHDVQLVMKTINLHRHGEGRSRLEEEMASVDGFLINGELTERQMASLIGCCDVYVSLHRAEGFGLGMAEAMYLGHPVIATAYSGNMEFTTAGNSCQIGYSMRPITHEEMRFNDSSKDVYRPGMLWAEPDLDQAAKWMRLLYEDPTLRSRIGDAGKRFVRSELSATTVGTRMRQRLTALAARS